MKPKHIFYLILAGLLVALFLWNRPIGAAAIVLVVVIVVVMKASAMQEADWVKKFGPELTKKIQAKKAEIGMNRAVIEAMWGKGENEKRKVDADGTTLQCDYLLKEVNGRKRYMYWAIFRNDVLVEYGDN